MGFRDRHPVFEKPADMHLDCLMHPLFCPLACLSGCDAAREIRGICRIIFSCFFYYDQEPVHDTRLRCTGKIRQCPLLPAEAHPGVSRVLLHRAAGQPFRFFLQELFLKAAHDCRIFLKLQNRIYCKEP